MEEDRDSKITRTIPWKERVQEHLSIAFPVCFTFVMRKSVDITSVIFVGHLGPHFLSSAGLASVTQNVSGNSMIIGLAGALSTLCSQANGAKNYVELGLSLQRAVIILMCLVCIPVSILWINSCPIFEILGQHPDIAKASSRYLISLIPGLWAMAASVSIQNWLHSQSKTKVVAMVTMLLAIVHPFICYLYIFVFRCSYLGAAYAVSTTKSLELASLLIYLNFFSTILQDTSFEWSWGCFHQWWQFLKLGIPNMMMMSEWWASEIIIFMSGSLSNPDVSVSAMSIYQSLNAICFMFPSAFHVSGATIVGNALGSGNPQNARTASFLAPALAVCATMFIAAGLMSCRQLIGFIFSSDASVVSTVSSLIPFLAVYVTVDGCQASLTGIIKGLGKQRVAGPVVIVSYYCVGLPVSYLLTFRQRHWGVQGLCVGILVGTVVHMLLYICIVYRTDWIAESDRVKQRNDRLSFHRLPLSVETNEEDQEVDEGSLDWLFSQLRKWSGLPVKASLAAEYELVRHCTDALSEFGLDDVDEDDVDDINESVSGTLDLVIASPDRSRLN